MFEKFKALNEEKQKRILNAAFYEFSHKRFKEASTDEIAANAGISKGALFQYFGTKKQLFLYAYRFAYDLLIEEFWNRTDLSEPDLLKRLKLIFSIKVNLFFRHPDLFNFIFHAYTKETDGELSAYIKEDGTRQLEQAYFKLLSGLDYTLFKPELDPVKVQSVIVWAVEGYGNAELAKYTQNQVTPQQCAIWVDELAQYLDILKTAFYR